MVAEVPRELRRAMARAYARLSVSLRVWLYMKLKVYFITLTSAPGSPSDIDGSFRKLLDAIFRQYGIRPEYAKVCTTEGYGVLHVYMVFEGKGMPQCRDWLKGQWERIHGAYIVGIRTLGLKDLSEKNDIGRYGVYCQDGGHDIARYATLDQITNGVTHFVRCDWSRKSYILLPVSMNAYIAYVRAWLASNVLRCAPRHCSYRDAIRVAVEILTVGACDFNNLRVVRDFPSYDLELL